MSLIIKHTFASQKADGPDDSVVRPSDWNANHIIAGFPGDPTQFLNGQGEFSVVGGIDLTADNSFSGVNRFSGKTHLGAVPSCDFAQVTVYQTMNNTTNSSMMDVVATGGGFSDMVGLLVISHSVDDLAKQTSLYVRADNDSGSIGQSIGIHIDVPQVSSHASTSYGILIANQVAANQSAAYNIYSVGFDSVNVFEGSVGIGTGTPTFPLVVQSESGVDGHYGQINADIICHGTEAGLRLNNTTTDGHKYNLISTGTGSSVGTGKFIIGDATVQASRFEIDPTGIITFNNAYHFPTTAGTTGQQLVLDGSASLTWNTTADSPIATNLTDQRLLVSLADPNFGSDLRVHRVASSFKDSDLGPNTTWFTMPLVPLNDAGWNTYAVGASISFFAYYTVHNPNINGNNGFQGMTKGRIEFLINSDAIEVSVDQNNNDNAMTFAVVSGRDLQFNFLGQWNNSQTRCNITIYCVAEVFNSPEYYC